MCELNVVSVHCTKKHDALGPKEQTRKTRYARWENTSNIFQLVAPEKLTGKHILLVDDIVTTGATIEAAAQELIPLKDTKISVACLGCAT
jgi:predicted amidophosphoribosyltransferase